MSEENEERPNGLTARIGTRQYYMNDRLLSLSALGIAIVILTGAAFRFLIHPGTIVVGIAQAASLAYGVWIGVQVEIEDLDDAGGHDEDEDIDQDGVTQ